MEDISMVRQGLGFERARGVAGGRDGSSLCEVCETGRSADRHRAARCSDLGSTIGGRENDVEETERTDDADGAWPTDSCRTS